VLLLLLPLWPLVVIQAAGLQGRVGRLLLQPPLPLLLLLSPAVHWEGTLSPSHTAASNNHEREVSSYRGCRSLAEFCW